MFKMSNKNTDANNVKPELPEYAYFSRVLNEPFNTVELLKEAEAAHYAKLKAKEDKAAQKKADAKTVEDAFKNLNTARKTYKEKLSQLTAEYSEALVNLKKTFEVGKADLHDTLAKAEEVYADALKAFTEKYPEGYHLTLKDGDFETTISSQTSGVKKDAVKATTDFSKLADIFDLMFRL